MRPVRGTGPALLACAVLIVSGCAYTGPSPGTPISSSTTPTASPASGEAIPSDRSGDVSLAASEITERLGTRDEFGSIGENQTGNALVLYWHGTPPALILDNIRANHPGITVEVRSAIYLPKDLRDAAVRMLEREVDAGIGAVGANPDGSGLTALVHEDKVHEELAAMAARLSLESGFPVRVDAGAPVPAS